MTQRNMVINGDLISQNRLRSTTTEACHSLAVASGGYEGINSPSHRLPYLDILDIITPDMDGGEVAAILNYDLSTKDIAVFLLSSLITRKIRKTTGKTEKILYPSKPYNKTELLNKMNKHFLEVK